MDTSPVVYLTNESQLKKYINSKINEILKDMSYSYDILRDAINLNSKDTEVDEFDKLIKEHVNSELKEVLKVIEKNHQNLKTIYDLQKISN